MGRLDVKVVSARNLPEASFGDCEPYVKLALENQEHRTSVEEKSTCVWNEIFKFQIADENSAQLKMTVWNKNLVSDDFIGSYSLSVSGLTRGRVRDQWLLLKQCKTQGEVRVRIIARDFGKAPPPESTSDDEPEPVQFGARRQHQRSYREQVAACYATNNLEKLDEVDQILMKYRGKEAQLIGLLQQKYGNEQSWNYALLQNPQVQLMLQGNVGTQVPSAQQAQQMYQQQMAPQQMTPYQPKRQRHLQQQQQQQMQQPMMQQQQQQMQQPMMQQQQQMGMGMNPTAAAGGVGGGTGGSNRHLGGCDVFWNDGQTVTIPPGKTIRCATYGPVMEQSAGGVHHDVTFAVQNLYAAATSTGQNWVVHGGIHTVLGDNFPGVSKRFKCWFSFSKEFADFETIIFDRPLIKAFYGLSEDPNSGMDCAKVLNEWISNNLDYSTNNEQTVPLTGGVHLLVGDPAPGQAKKLRIITAKKLSSNLAENALLKQAFDSWDCNGDDSLDRSEAMAACMQYGLIASPAQMMEVFSRADVNNDGVLSFEEFAALVGPAMKASGQLSF